MNESSGTFQPALPGSSIKALNELQAKRIAELQAERDRLREALEAIYWLEGNNYARLYMQVNRIAGKALDAEPADNAEAYEQIGWNFGRGWNDPDTSVEEQNG